MDKALNNIEMQLDALKTKTKKEGTTGFITYYGLFASEGGQSNWISDQINTDTLLTVNEYSSAAKVLACIGSNDGFNIILSLLRTPKTTAHLINECGFTDAKQVYHHLNLLLTADLIKKDEHNPGYYLIQPHRVQGIIMMLAGICEMLNEMVDV